jgi:hypothetical protein
MKEYQVMDSVDVELLDNLEKGVDYGGSRFQLTVTINEVDGVGNQLAPMVSVPLNNGVLTYTDLLRLVWGEMETLLKPGQPLHPDPEVARLLTTARSGWETLGGFVDSFDTPENRT